MQREGGCLLKLPLELQLALLLASTGINQVWIASIAEKSDIGVSFPNGLLDLSAFKTQLLEPPYGIDLDMYL